MLFIKKNKFIEKEKVHKVIRHQNIEWSNNEKRFTLFKKKNIEAIWRFSKGQLSFLFLEEEEIQQKY